MNGRAHFLCLMSLLNFVDKTNAGHCYVCSNVESIRLLPKIQDSEWKAWLKNLSSEPQTDDCLDDFTSEYALRSGVKSQHCHNGACLKMTISEKSGGTYIWRSCLNNSAELVRSDCTEISTKQGTMNICTCFGHLCNTSSSTFLSTFAYIIPIIFVIIY